MQDLLQSYQVNRQVYYELKEKKRKFLFLLDGYDELKVPKNMFVTNKLNEWKGVVKLLVTSRQEYLIAYGNYVRFFKPNFKDNSKNVVLEYRISEVSAEQRKVYIDKTVLATQNRLNLLNPLADKDEIALLQEWASAKKYHDSINDIVGLLDLIKTPYMLTIIMNILPELDKNKTSSDEKITKSVIYKTFTHQFFERAQNRILSNESEEIPKGFDIESSFYNFSCALAIKMFLNNKTSIQASENKYSFPTKEV